MVVYDAALDYDAALAWDGVPLGFARYIVRVDWNNDGDFLDTYDEITDDVLEITCKQGRNFASQLTGKAVAGTLEVKLKNNTGKYSPFNTSSVLTGSLFPNRRIEVAAYLPTETTIWSGYIENIQPTVTKGAYTSATIKALGIFKKFATTDARVTMQTSRTTGAAIGDVLDAVSWSAPLRSIDTGQTTMTRFFGSGKALALMRQIESTESGFLRETKDGKVAFEDRYHRLNTAASTTSQATFADDGTGYSYMAIQQQDAMSLLYNEFLCPVSTYTTGSVTTLWTHPLADTAGNAPTLAAGEVITILAEYPNPDTANGAVAVDAWTTPAATTDYLANAATGGGGTDYTSSLGISTVKSANNMQIQVTNNAAVTVHLTKFQARGTAVTVSNPATVLASDSTSQTAYGVRSYPRSNEAKWVPTQQEAKSWALQNLGAHKQPTPVIQISYSANQSGAVLASALALDVSDRVTVKASANAKLGLDRDFYIESITHQIKAGGAHQTIYSLSDTAGFAGFWVLGTSALGRDTRLTY